MNTEQGANVSAAAEQQSAATAPAGQVDAEPLGSGTGAVRSWLRPGGGAPAADPRRRSGDHAQARRALAGPAAAGQTNAAWHGLVSALHRHTVDAGLAELQQHERQLLTLAFLQGRSNSELAAMLGVSVRTVRRRLSQALAKLDEYVSRVGIWIASLLLFALAAVGWQGSRLSRVLVAARSPAAVAVLGGGVAAAAALGVLVLNPAAPPVRASAAPSSAQSIRFSHPAGIQAGIPGGGTQDTASAPKSPASSAPSRVASTSAATSDNDRHGCGRKPTDAPPDVPVGPRDGATGPPVTHPGPGGCGNGEALGLHR